MAANKRSYYGAFFWLSLAAFVVPIVVAVRAFEVASRPYSKPEPKPDESGVAHNVWDYLLKTYARDGLVDYEGIKRDHLFKTYLRQLGQARPENLPSDKHRLALLCNAYNAFVINGVITHRIKESVSEYKPDGKEFFFFRVKEHIFAGKTISLDHIEKKMILPVYKDPRAHMALVCAARSCPVIRPEAYSGESIERQLEDQARKFANDPQYVRYDAETATLHLSAILQWYENDFKASGGYRKFLADRVEKQEPKKALEKAAKDPTSVKVEFNTYDWALNVQTIPGKKQGPARKTDFGSGSVPNQ